MLCISTTTENGTARERKEKERRKKEEEKSGVAFSIKFQLTIFLPRTFAALVVFVPSGSCLQERVKSPERCVLWRNSLRLKKNVANRLNYIIYSNVILFL